MSAPRRRLAWRIALLVLLVGLLAGGVALYTGFDRYAGVPLTVVIDDEAVVNVADMAGVTPGHRLVLVAGALAALLVAAVVVATVLPLTLLLVLLCVAGVLLLVLGAPLLAVSLVLAVVASPLIVLGLLLWWLLRRPRRAAAAAPAAPGPSARIGA